MNLLKYEFMDAAEGSYNGLLKELVQKVRHNRENVPLEGFRAAIPELHRMESVIQKLDEAVGSESRDYIQEIMEELEREDVVQDEVLEEIERSSKAITASYDLEFDINDFNFEFKKNQGIFWIHFYGYKNQGAILALSIVKEVFRSVCYHAGVTFIDSSE